MPACCQNQELRKFSYGDNSCLSQVEIHAVLYKIMRLVVFNDKIIAMGAVRAEIERKSVNLITLVESYLMLLFWVICDITFGIFEWALFKLFNNKSKATWKL